MKSLRRLFTIASILTTGAVSVSPAARAVDFKVLHSFAGGANDGAGPQYGSLTIDGTTLYGMTMFGGSSNRGTVFQINADGSGFNVLHSFTGSSDGGVSTDGMYPQGSLTLSGTNLYGMALYGGNAGIGNVFKIGTNGNDFTVLHSFSGGDGANPFGDLTVSGSTLYGMTYLGGDGYGVIFKIDSHGTGFTSVAPFSSDNSGPLGGLTLSGSTLYGMNRWSGIAIEGGSLFQINTDLTTFNVLHRFTGATNDGAAPLNSNLTLGGSTLYGVTGLGGSSGDGTIFKLNVDGSGFGILHSFQGGSPIGTLILSGSTLYGMCGGGSNGQGTIFSINTDGTGFQDLFSFNGTNGRFSMGSLAMSGSTLYGMTSQGGSSNQGVIFSLTIPEPSTFALLGVGTAALLAWGWWRRRQAA